MEKAKEKDEVKKEDGKRFELVEVPTQTSVMVRDSKLDSIMDDKQVLIDILNSLDEIKRAVC